MKAELHGVHCLDPAVAGKQTVQGSAKGDLVPGGGCGKADGLAYGVNPGVGATGGVGYGAASEEAFENLLDLQLDRAAVGLALPPDEAGAVVVERGEKGPAHLSRI